MWGISRATDLLLQETKLQREGGTKHVLLICSSDPRSILKTISSAQQNKFEAIRFYIVEEQREILARQFLLVHAFLDESVPIRQRAQRYLELLGNVSLTPEAFDYLVETASSLVDLVLDNKCLSKTACECNLIYPC